MTSHIKIARVRVRAEEAYEVESWEMHSPSTDDACALAPCAGGWRRARISAHRAGRCSRSLASDARPLVRLPSKGSDSPFAKDVIPAENRDFVNIAEAKIGSRYTMVTPTPPYPHRIGSAAALPHLSTATLSAPWMCGNHG